VSDTNQYGEPTHDAAQVRSWVGDGMRVSDHQNPEPLGDERLESGQSWELTRRIREALFAHEAIFRILS
jgi:hypothetical protein